MEEMIYWTLILYSPLLSRLTRFPPFKILYVSQTEQSLVGHAGPEITRQSQRVNLLLGLYEQMEIVFS